jgi:lipoprotein-releasing system ATP-binding protein
MNSVLRCENISKTFEQGKLQVSVLREVSLTIQAGESVAIVGASGSGKSTLLHLLGGLEQPSTGTVWVKNQAISQLSPAAAGQLRNQHLGFIYQFHHLLSEFTAQENVAMPLLIARKSKTEAMQQAAACLEKVGLSHRLAHKPGELSGGERQRAAIARAMVTQPSCILADEPTGNLDSKTANQIVDLLLEMQQFLQTSLVMVTHDMRLAQRTQQIYTMQDGLLAA